MIDFIVSVQLKFFDPVITDFSAHDLVFGHPNPT